MPRSIRCVVGAEKTLTHRDAKENKRNSTRRFTFNVVWVSRSHGREKRRGQTDKWCNTREGNFSASTHLIDWPRTKAKHPRSCHRLLQARSRRRKYHRRASGDSVMLTGNQDAKSKFRTRIGMVHLSRPIVSIEFRPRRHRFGRK